MRAIFKQTAAGVGLIIIVFIVLSTLRLVYFMPLSIKCQQTVHWPGETPHGAIWERETVHWDHVPDGYTTLVGWVNAASAVPCADETAATPRIEIRVFRIIAIDGTGRETILTEIDPRDPHSFVGRLFPRVPKWFGETKGRDERNIASPLEDRLSLDLGQVPLRIYHAWTKPRLPIDPTMTYVLEIEANITETARLQFGVDYWRDTTSDYNGWDGQCVHSANCEGWVSDWQGDTDGEFRTFRAPAAVTVPAVVTGTH
ncbi:MAG: hypothetical protein IPJ68_02370 [Candidatus Moraniibacteriota bacterium]|nr:MAG: hypothetical protein IPJ68_02370 [Candidatus Moranbacteria bacterium]